MRRLVAAGGALLALVALLVIGPASPASAHAVLLSTDPTEGALLAAAPDRIRFLFNEDVVEVPDGVQVYDAEGDEIASSIEVSGASLAIALTGDVPDGTLVVVWRVLSEDGHPVRGSLTFSIGAPSSSVTPPPDDADAGTDAPWVLSLVRWAGYLGLLVAGGLAAFVALVLPRGREVAAVRERALAGGRVAAGVAAVAWPLALPITAAYQLGGGLGSLADGATWGALPPTEYGVAAAAAIGPALAVRLLVGDPARAVRALALALAALAVGAPALTGHTRAASPELLVVGTDVLHLLAGATWLGGLVGVAVVLVDLAARGEHGAAVLARFSGIAAGVLALLVASGSVVGWRVVGSWDGLFGTGYGRLLLVKVAIALVAVAIAAWNRFRLLPRMRHDGRRKERREDAALVVRATQAEAGVLVAVLLLTGFLVDRSPKTDSSLSASADPSEVGPHAGQLGDLEVVAAVSPHVVGPATLTVQVRDSSGVPVEGVEPPRLRVSSGDVDLGALTVEQVATGTYAGELVFPHAGEWEVQVSLRTSEFDNPVTTIDFPVFES